MRWSAMSFSMFSMGMAGWPDGRSSALLQGACKGCLGCKRLISFNKRWRPPVVSHQIDAFFLRVAPLWCDNWKRLATARPNPVGTARAAMQFVGWVERSETQHPRATGHADGLSLGLTNLQSREGD